MGCRTLVLGFPSTIWTASLWSSSRRTQPSPPNSVGPDSGSASRRSLLSCMGGASGWRVNWGRVLRSSSRFHCASRRGNRRERQSDSAFLLLAHFHRHGGDRLVFHRHVLRHGSQTFLPELEAILARGYIIENELPMVVRDRIEGMLGDHHPGSHPEV